MLKNTFFKAYSLNIPKVLHLQSRTLFFTVKNSQKPPLFLTKQVAKKHFFSTFFERKLQSLRYPLYYYLIGANVLVYLAWNSGLISKKFLFENFTLSKLTIARHRLHTLITYSFSHTNILHLAMNMMVLFFFGKFIEINFGSKVLFQLYMLGALIGGLFITSQNNRKRHIAVHLGASGATTAILSFFIMNFPYHTIFIYFFPVPAWIVGALIFLQSLVYYENEDGVSYSGHLGGFVAGLGMYFHLRGRVF